MRLRRETGDFSISLSWDSTNKKYDLLTPILPKSLGLEDFVGVAVAVYNSGVIDGYYVPTAIGTAVGEADNTVIIIYLNDGGFRLTYDPSTGKLTCVVMNGGDDGEPKR